MREVLGLVFASVSRFFNPGDIEEVFVDGLMSIKLDHKHLAQF